MFFERNEGNICLKMREKQCEYARLRLDKKSVYKLNEFSGNVKKLDE